MDDHIAPNFYLKSSFDQLRMVVRIGMSCVASQYFQFPAYCWHRHLPHPFESIPSSGSLHPNDGFVR